MARVLIVGGGCRGLRLAEEAGREGHAVRVVTRTEGRRPEIEAAGAECRIGDPNRLGTLRGVLDGVTVACWLMGGATGPEEQLRALHSDRLRAFLESAIDSTVRGLLYEAAGSSMPPGALAEGERIAWETARRNAIPLVVLDSDPADIPRWSEQASGALSEMLTP